MNTTTIRGFFDQSVQEWDTDRYQDETYVGRARVALNWLKPGPVKRIFDVGCGTGRQVATLLNAGHRVVAADFSFPMAQATRNRIQRECIGKPVMVVVADAMSPPFRDETFEAVLALGVVGFLPDRSKFVNAAHDILTSQGELICDVGVPEQDVLFQKISASLTRLRARLLGIPVPPHKPGWYSQNFRKHTPAEFEQLLGNGHFQVRACGGGGFGDLQVAGTPVVPWRLQNWLARTLSRLSTLRFGRPLARHALTYVVRSAKIATSHSNRAA